MPATIVGTNTTSFVSLGHDETLSSIVKESPRSQANLRGDVHGDPQMVCDSVLMLDVPRHSPRPSLSDDVDRKDFRGGVCDTIASPATSILDGDALMGVGQQSPGARPCIAWLREQRTVQNASEEDGLAYAIEFFDPRADSGGWIRIGYDAQYQLRYSCNGVLRPVFRQAMLSICGVEAYLDFPDLQKGVVMQFTHHAAEVLLPAVRDAFDDSGVSHNIPDDATLCRFLMVSPSMVTDLLSPRDIPFSSISREAGCQLCHSSCSVM
eukprot:TRINITY_DN17244_c1_g2_i1.p1 TRINITY_DN17244_c1_g2~~TRINITY_DN17244_c1_g2_i1.p1  ORF type:complete len:266 (+),score=38.12 TRINITY_DN17244_c1_g2_i1:190-987(+)